VPQPFGLADHVPPSSARFPGGTFFSLFDKKPASCRFSNPRDNPSPDLGLPPQLNRCFLLFLLESGSFFFSPFPSRFAVSRSGDRLSPILCLLPCKTFFKPGECWSLSYVFPPFSFPIAGGPPLLNRSLAGLSSSHEQIFPLQSLSAKRSFSVVCPFCALTQRTPSLERFFSVRIVFSGSPRTCPPGLFSLP